MDMETKWYWASLHYRVKTRTGIGQHHSETFQLDVRTLREAPDKEHIVPSSCVM